MRNPFPPMRFSVEPPSRRPQAGAESPEFQARYEMQDGAGPKRTPAEQQNRSKTGLNPGQNGRQIHSESVDDAQPSDDNGVPEDMATLVIDNPGFSGAQTSSEVGRQHSIIANGRPEKDSEGTERTDAEVMLAVAAGDEAGFNYLVGRYNRQIIHFLFRMVHNEAVAEELAQEVFLRVYRSRESYRAEAKFSTWLYRIATNLAVNHARDTKSERTAPTMNLSEPDPESGSLPEVADDELNVEQRMMREERMAAIRAQVSALPERQRMAVLMHKYQEMDYRQIGDVLKLSESATKSLLFRAYQTLRDKLKDFV